MSKVSKNVLAKIKKGQVKPRPKWQFVLWHVLFWVLFLFSIALGSTVTGMMIHELVVMQWDFVPHLGGAKQIKLFILPVIWLITIALMVFLAYQSFLHTKKGYRYRPAIIVLGSVLISVVLGMIVSYTQMADKIDEFAGKHFGPYAAIQDHVDGVWLEPGENMIAGEITEKASDTEWTVVTYGGSTWTVLIDEESQTGGHEYEEGMNIIVLGETYEDEEGAVKEITAEQISEFKRGPKGDGEGRPGGPDATPGGGQGDVPKFERKSH